MDGWKYTTEEHQVYVERCGWLLKDMIVWVHLS